jgi:hypothetical protein
MMDRIKEASVRNTQKVVTAHLLNHSLVWQGEHFGSA